MRHVLFALLLATATPWGASPAFAAPVQYQLDKAQSSIVFSFDLEGQPLRGTVPVSKADVVIDWDALSRSKVSATFNMKRAKAGVVFATQAMKGASVLDVDAFNTASFVTRSVENRGGGAARLRGDLTLKGVTRPVTLDGRIYRQRGSDANDLSALELRFTGAINRKAFGVSGFPNLVGDTVSLSVTAFITRQN